ncbi:uncharacterized protein LOC9320411 [Arabidopsis lyrata subsp. lyrata]|uniref:uncharacterized protein LOC9320411 n=1 Tax=Arabidopsis lyrata subsp. lyrata TaxID=81972 RepID=UPI000A29C0A2|nr:uncharacterized protein LOC9320411 [Arabidopsis lyrata subsp. lyrata]XP_020886849.1 uncharacterized protein LOC9320411 [Arabidopsis lyrata subsp. lyrata]XP_020886850.1 uncharacterized protein LOC9320411 [Arabidopsis lyrata subsp. lyrata]|eukprot:XP_020886847.1 uncharacterized protein LOC9320411 [Arabidopsis lyrata subsp. lyrata]
MIDRRAGNRSMGRKSRPKMQSGTCNVCSAPCSSCMHRNAEFTSSKSDESPDENSHGVLASQCSFNGDNLLRSSGVNAPGSSHNTASEASHLVNSNRDTSSENAESMEIIRSSDISHGPILDRSRKEQDSIMVDSCSDHQARSTLGQGKVKEKSGANNIEDKKNTLTGSSKHSGRRVGKSGENVLLNNADESNTSAMSESESETDPEMLDVKVCDTCGDAGREDLLAICSRCSDGAEHTYCMRVMLKKVPKGYWLCEECKFAEEAEKQKLETKGKRESEVNRNTQSSSKRHIDKFETAPDSKRLAVEAPTGSPKRSVLPRVSALSRETSFKGLEKPARKLAHHSSFNSYSSDDTESTRSTDSQLRSPKGSFYKSNSFNSSSSRPKVRPVDDVMLPRQKTGKGNSSFDVKEGFSKNVGKSMSSRCIDVGSSSCNGSEVKGSKQLKDRSTVANPSVSISRGNSSIPYAKSPRDLKDLQSDGKQGSLSKQARHLSRNRLEDIVASVGDSSKNEKCSSSEQISSETKCKDELAHVDGLPRSREFREAGEKSKDAVGNHQKQNISEDINKGNRLRAAVDAALRKKPSFSKNRGLEQSDLPSVSNVDSGCNKALKSLPSKVPVIRDWPVGFQGLPGGHPNLRTDKQTNAVNGNQSTLAGTDAMAAFQSVELEVNFPSVKPVMRDLPVAAPNVLSTTSAIPEHEYIWQGDLEVQKSRNLSAMHSGIQAYLSTSASPKVVEVVKQFPEKVTLNEVPRLSSWPAQFQDTGAKEQHVALFFFAKDIESYEKNYKPLVDNMIQKDLALKGSLEGVELLIFASNQLPQDCQRWNMLFFLWGVFRGKKESCSNPPKNTRLPASCVLPNMKKAFSTRETFHHENPSNRESLTDRTSNRMQSCMKEEKAKEGKACGAIEKENAFSVSYGERGVAEEIEEGEIGVSPHLKDEKTGPGTVKSSDMNQKVSVDDLNKEGLCEGPANKKLKTVTGVETGCSIVRRDTSVHKFASKRTSDI